VRKEMGKLNACRRCVKIAAAIMVSLRFEINANLFKSLIMIRRLRTEGKKIKRFLIVSSS
jgi:hypothetical protein